MSISFTAGGDTANAVYRRFFSPAGGNIGITAHIGGMLAGKLTHEAPPSDDNIKYCHFFKNNK